MHTSRALIFVIAAQGTSLDNLTLVGSGNYVYRSHRTIIEKEFLTSHLPGPSREAVNKKAQSFHERSLLTYLYSCVLRDTLLIKHISRDLL